MGLTPFLCRIFFHLEKNAICEGCVGFFFFFYNSSNNSGSDFIKEEGPGIFSENTLDSIALTEVAHLDGFVDCNFFSSQVVAYFVSILGYH